MNDIPPGISTAAPWSLFTGKLGQGSVIASIVFFVIALFAMIAAKRLPKAEKVGVVSFILGGFGLFIAFGALATLFIKDQFQFSYVWQHSDTTTSLPYKIASVWTAQEGSFLLWSVTAALFALLGVRGTGPYRRGFVGAYSLLLATLGGILAYETPFGIMKEVIAHGKVLVPPTGNGMVPSLQNYWVVIHPPIIFLGFGSLSLFAAYAIAAMFRGDAKDWIHRVRPWVLASVAILGLGISLGGLWAYETQGWGGFWAWDPVENVSFVPWLFLVVFAHGIIVQATRGKWAGMNLILGGLPFLSFVYGTYLTRSGLLDKVSTHSFASMNNNARGILLLFLVGVVVAFTALYATLGRSAARAIAPEAAEEQVGNHREAFYRFGMLLLGLLATVIALGMSWPVFTALRSGQGSAVKEPLYHLVVTWFFLPLMVLMAVTPFVSWRRMEGSTLRDRLFGVVCISIGLTGVLHLILLSTSLGVRPEPGGTVAGPFNIHVPLALWMLVLLFSVVFVIVANVWRVTELAKRSALGTGGFVSHLGIAVLLGGLILSRGYERKETIIVRSGSPASALGYTVTYEGPTKQDFYDRDRKVEFEVTTPQGSKFIARPGHYKYGNDEPKDQVWPHIERLATHDVYIAMAAPEYLVTPKPIVMKPGDKKDVGGSTLEYLRMTQKGGFGQAGTEFGTELRLTQQSEDGENHQYLATPVVRFTKEMTLEPVLAPMGPDLIVAIAGGINPADKSAPIALMFNPPLYPIEIYEKPYTSMVWAGTGILTFGGLLAAFSRRRVTARQRAAVPATLSDAPVPAPQS